MWRIPGGIMTERYVDKLRREHRERMRRLWPSKTIIPIICHDPREAEIIPISRVTNNVVAPLPIVGSNPTLTGILAAVCARHNLDTETVRKKGGGANKPRIVMARAEYCYLAARDTAASVREIGSRIERHRATVMYAVAGYCEQLGLPVPREGKWDAYRKRKERYRAMRDVTRSVGCPTSEQSEASQPGQRPH